MAIPRLEELARRYAAAAVQAERNGDRDEAITNYKRAVEALRKILELDPRTEFAKIYVNAIKHYTERIKQLEDLREPVAVGSSGGDIDVDELILKEKPNVSFNDIVGLEHAKEALKRAVIYAVKYPHLYGKIGWPQGILLFGPSGCGKTMLAAATANAIEGVVFYVSAADIMSKWLGESEKKIAKLFESAREYAERGIPALIFIDEVDDLFGVFSSEVGGEVRVRNQFLDEMDGLKNKHKKLHLYVLAATNKPHKLDKAFIRRFPVRIYIPPPNHEARKQLFEHYVREWEIEVDSTVDFDELARLTEGYSASDIVHVIREAYYKAVSELIDLIEKGSMDPRSKPRPLSMEDFLSTLRRVKPSLSKEQVRIAEKWNAEHGTVI